VSAEIANTFNKTPYELKRCFAGDTTGFVEIVVEELKD
jgi:hypothetical protein